MKVRTLLEATNPKMTFPALVTKYKLKKVRRVDYTAYVCSTPKGQVIFDIAGSPGDYNIFLQHPEVRKIKTPPSFKNAAEIDAFLESHRKELDKVVDVKKTDDEILKWVAQQLGVKIKPNELKNWDYIKWPKSIELQDREYSCPYNQFIEGQEAYDDNIGLGKISLSLKEFEEWLNRMGFKKKQKPKRSFSSSYYD